MANRIVREKIVRDDTDSDRVAADNGRPATLLTNIIWFIAGVIIFLLAFRFVLSLLGANRGNSFADFIYNASHPFAAPFFGLFNYDNINYGVSRFELYTLIAIAVYAVIAWGLTALVNIARR